MHIFPPGSPVWWALPGHPQGLQDHHCHSSQQAMDHLHWSNQTSHPVYRGECHHHLMWPWISMSSALSVRGEVLSHACPCLHYDSCFTMFFPIYDSHCRSAVILWFSPECLLLANVLSSPWSIYFSTTTCLLSNCTHLAIYSCYQIKPLFFLTWRLSSVLSLRIYNSKQVNATLEFMQRWDLSIKIPVMTWATNTCTILFQGVCWNQSSQKDKRGVKKIENLSGFLMTCVTHRMVCGLSVQLVWYMSIVLHSLTELSYFITLFQTIGGHGLWKFRTLLDPDICGLKTNRYEYQSTFWQRSTSQSEVDSIHNMCFIIFIEYDETYISWTHKNLLTFCLYGILSYSLKFYSI